MLSHSLPQDRNLSTQRELLLPEEERYLACLGGLQVCMRCIPQETRLKEKLGGQIKEDVECFAVGLGFCSVLFGAEKWHDLTCIYKKLALGP